MGSGAAGRGFANESGGLPVVAHDGGDVPVGDGERGRVGDLHGGEGKLARGPIGGEEGRGRGLRDGVVLGGGNGGRGGVPGRGEGSGGLAWGGMERGGAGTQGGEAKWGEGARQKGA